MKAKSLRNYKALTFILLGLLVFPLNSCDECKDVTKGAKLADLVLKAVDAVSQAVDSTSTTYKVIHSVINSAANIDCPEEVAEAGQHMDMIPIEYSTSSNFDNVITVAESIVPILESIDQNGTYNVENIIDFAVDGFYRLNNQIDFNNDVQERNEDNNNEQIPVAPDPGSRTSITTSSGGIILQIKNSGNVLPKFDQNGKPIYIKSWDIKVSYE